jgi:IS605 OrfB family transposase
MRQAWFSQRHKKSIDLPNQGILIDAVRKLECYKNIHNTKTAKQTIRKCWFDWSNFRKALREYGHNTSKFTKCPKPPNYKKKMAQVIFDNETIKGGRSKKKFDRITPTNECFSIPCDKKYKQVIITPKSFGFIIEIRYETTENLVSKKEKLDKNKVATIDIGLNTLAAITYGEKRPILINGRIVKSINQWYNKRQCKSRLRKRYFRLENFFHHVSKFIVDLCVTEGIGTLVIGKNVGWKSKINLGKKTNQNFCFLPIRLLLEKIKYKALIVGIEVVFTEESYTSKASFYHQDPLPNYNSDTSILKFSGKRKHRGLYVTNDGFAINADVNGSLNIGRKVIPEFLGIRDRSLAARPVVVNPLKVSR